MILVDTSIWVDHFKKGNPTLKQLLNKNEVLIHPFTIGELACGNLKNRSEILGLLEELPQAVVADSDEVMLFIERNHLYGLGIGWIDVHLVASTMLSKATMMTLDKPLEKIAKRLNIFERSP